MFTRTSIFVLLAAAFVGFLANPGSAQANRPDFIPPFECGQSGWIVHTWTGHAPSELNLDINRAGNDDKGKPVYASASGVVDTNPYPSSSAPIEIDHGDGWATRYLHMDRIQVSDGQRVGQGTLLGYISDVGSLGSVHLHYEQRHNGAAVAIVWEHWAVPVVGDRYAPSVYDNSPTGFGFTEVPARDCSSNDFDRSSGEFWRADGVEIRSSDEIYNRRLEGVCSFSFAGTFTVLYGTDGPDRIVGTEGQDLILTGGGADRVWGRGGNDVICTGDGPDRVFGGKGNDRISGGAGRDRLDGGKGDDFLEGVSGRDFLYGRGGVDSLSGGSGADVLVGGSVPVGSRQVLHTGGTPAVGRGETVIANTIADPHNTRPALCGRNLAARVDSVRGCQFFDGLIPGPFAIANCLNGGHWSGWENLCGEPLFGTGHNLISDFWQLEVR